MGLSSTTHVEVAADESGSEGENLAAAGSRVFAHATTDLSLREAGEAIQYIRHESGSNASEIKSKVLLQNLHLVSDLLGSNGLLRDRVHIHLTEKSYFVAGKIIDLLVEPYAYERGIDLFQDGDARSFAYRLYKQGPKVLGLAKWNELLMVFNSAVRLKQRKGNKNTVADFYLLVKEARRQDLGKDLGFIMDAVWATREGAYQLQYDLDNGLTVMPEMDPLLTATATSARFWHEKSGLPVTMVHDQQSVFTTERLSVLLKYSQTIDPQMGLHLPGFPFLALDLADSRTDERVQVADLMAGLGRMVGEAVLAGESVNFLEIIRRHLDENLLWGDESSFLALSGRALPV